MMICASEHAVTQKHPPASPSLKRLRLPLSHSGRIFLSQISVLFFQIRQSENSQWALHLVRLGVGGGRRGGGGGGVGFSIADISTAVNVASGGTLHH